MKKVNPCFLTKPIPFFTVFFFLSVYLYSPLLIGNMLHNWATYQFQRGLLHDNVLEMQHAEFAERMALAWLPSNFSQRADNNLIRILLSSNGLQDDAIIENGIKFIPDSALYFDIGNFYWELGDKQEAVFYWEKVSNVEVVIISQALNHQGNEREKNVLTSVEKLKSLDPKIDPSRSGELFINLAQALLESENTEDAIIVYEKVRESGYRSAWVNMNIGKIYYYDFQEYGLAESYFREAYQIDPKFYRVELWLGLALLNQGNVDAAISIFKNAYKRTPQDGLLNFELGKALLQIGDIDTAKIHLLKSLESQPSIDGWEYDYYVDLARKLLAGISD